MDGAAVMLEPRVAVQMAMVLHELADNGLEGAIDHG